MNSYPFGQSIRFSASFANNGVPTNPTVTQFKLGVQAVSPPPDPTAAIIAQFGVDVAVLNPSTGNFTYDVTPVVPGLWTLQAVGTGVVQAASPPIVFRVLPSPFA
jgi:hypothetical protein